jgi:threonine synthase
LAASSDFSIWRYLELLPITGGKGLPPLQVGWTPIYDCPGLANRYGLGELRIKDEGREPTGSFKDRASALGTVKARELGFDTIACASTGNAASSLAGFCASQGLQSIIFVPSYALEAKVAQLRAFGAIVLLVQGTYEEAYDLCQKSVEAFGWYNRNCAVNPYLIEGKKTCGLEIAEQCANRPPDVVAVSVGDGCTIAGIWKGMKEMQKLGIWDRTPRLLGVQPEGAAPIVKAHASGTLTLEKREAHSVADSISVAEPHNWRKAMNAVAESGGTWIMVSDEAIMDACKELAAETGVFAEPAGAAAFAGILRAREKAVLSATDSILHVVTGNGLKDIKSATARAPEPHEIQPSLDAVRKVIE